jgi:Tol biopolymer transport system component
MTPDGREFHELTGYSPFKATGVLVPRFSPDGKRILWTELIAGPKDKKVQSGPFGRWQINIADFVMEGPTPKLSNIRPMTPGNGIFYEVQDWSPDGRKILFASDIGRTSVMVVDLFSYDLRSARPTNLTDTDDQWEEQGAFSPDGRKIVYMSSRGAPGFDPRNIQTLRTEDFLMNADGSNSAQLTHFNTTGYPEYDRESSAATKAAWSPSGSQLVVEQQMMGKSYNKAKSRLHLLTFVGACGAQ